MNIFFIFVSIYYYEFNLLKTNLKQPLIFDGKNQFDKYHMKDIGFEYHQIGVPLLK